MVFFVCFFVNVLVHTSNGTTVLYMRTAGSVGRKDQQTGVVLANKFNSASHQKKKEKLLIKQTKLPLGFLTTWDPLSSRRESKPVCWFCYLQSLANQGWCVESLLICFRWHQSPFSYYENKSVFYSISAFRLTLIQKANMYNTPIYSVNNKPSLLWN